MRQKVLIVSQKGQFDRKVLTIRILIYILNHHLTLKPYRNEKNQSIVARVMRYGRMQRG